MGASLQGLRAGWRKVGGGFGGHKGNNPALKGKRMDSAQDKPRAEVLINKVTPDLGQVDTLTVSD